MQLKLADKINILLVPGITDGSERNGSNRREHEITNEVLFGNYGRNKKRGHAAQHSTCTTPTPANSSRGVEVPGWVAFSSFLIENLSTGCILSPPCLRSRGCFSGWIRPVQILHNVSWRRVGIVVVCCIRRAKWLESVDCLWISFPTRMKLRSHGLPQATQRADAQ